MSRACHFRSRMLLAGLAIAWFETGPVEAQSLMVPSDTAAGYGRPAVATAAPSAFTPASAARPPRQVLTLPAPPAAPSFSVGTHVRFAQPRVTFSAGEEGGVEFNAHGTAEPGVEVSQGGFGVSLSGALLRNPAQELLSAGLSARKGVQDFRTRYHGAAWGVEAHHVRANGFDWSGRVQDVTREEYRPDVTMTATSVTVYRSFDPDSRVYRLSEGLSESGGNVDVFLTAGASRAVLQGERALVPLARSSDSRFEGAERVGVTSASVGAGYAITSNMLGLYFDQSLFGGYGPQIRTWGERSDLTWNLAKVNFRVAMGIRARWFDVGVGLEDEAYSSFAGSDRMVAHAFAAQAKLGLFW